MHVIFLSKILKRMSHKKNKVIEEYFELDIRQIPYCI